MKIWLKEVFGVEEPQYMAGVAFETVAYDNDKNAKVKRRGWEIPYQAADPYDIESYAMKYQIPGRRGGDSRKSWESEEPFQDGMTGDETYYIIHIKNIDGSDVSEEEFGEINDLINSESSEGWGIQTTPRPLVLR